MCKIVIGVITCSRDKMLKRCLESVVTSAKKIKEDCSLVVIDNNSKPISKDTVSSVGGLNIIYDWEPKKGIPYARNRALKVALTLNPDYIAFIDDDEWVDPDWLKNILPVINNDNVDVVSGPVFQVSNNMVKDKKNIEDKKVRDRAETDNVIFKSWIASDIKFDEDFAMTGGSDTLFFRQAFERGAKIVHCNSAVVFEELPLNRQSLRWRIQRQFRYGLTHCMIERKLTSGKSLLLLFIRALLLVPVGSVEALFGLFAFNLERVRKGFYRAIRGVGSISYFFGTSYEEYKR